MHEARAVDVLQADALPRQSAPATLSQPPKHNFKKTPVVLGPPYQYRAEHDDDPHVANL
ncbi:MAG: hypothetical protein M3Q86_12925 [Verrucomicrobiota bacterium]|nr:hypothetical protein [Verrucomicrobiota bacterium]